ncbi:MAG: PqqD family peptide modification chaperone [Anaerolineae bacterium]|nr:PqqD family peptide modification chaperone [Anaerolineae bacterium]NUQ06625.1 PqqD family protein [Anaerolineae bacterium]
MSTESMTLQTVVQRSPDLLFTEVNGDLVMLSIRTNQYYGTHAVGGRIWALIEQPTPIQVVCDALLREFEVDAATCQAETLAFLNRLAQESLLILHAPA